MRSRDLFCAVKLRCKLLIQYFVDERRLAGARNTGYANKLAERYFGIYIFQIVLACVDYLETFAVALSALCRNGNFLAAAKILPGY